MKNKQHGVEIPAKEDKIKNKHGVKIPAKKDKMKNKQHGVEIPAGRCGCRESPSH